MTTPTVLKRLLDRLPEFYKQEGTYNKTGISEIGRLFYNEMSEAGHFADPDIGVGGTGLHYVDFILLITGDVNYKLASILVQEQLDIDLGIVKADESNKVDYADGINLDRLGRIFDISRGDWSDDELRRFIKSAVTGLIGGGTSPNLKTALSITIGIPVSSILISDVSAAHIKITVPYEYITSKPELSTVITKYKPAGVSYELQVGYICRWGVGKWGGCTWA